MTCPMALIFSFPFDLIKLCNEIRGWVSVLNDTTTCQKAGIAPIQLTHDLPKYITEKNHKHVGGRVARLFQGGRFGSFAPGQTQSAISPIASTASSTTVEPDFDVQNTEQVKSQRDVWRLSRPLEALWNNINPLRYRTNFQHWGVFVSDL